MQKEVKMFIEMTQEKISFEDFISEIKKIGVSEHYARRVNTLTPEQKSANAKKAIAARWAKKVSN